jgi:hypothetical protein
MPKQVLILLLVATPGLFGLAYILLPEFRTIALLGGAVATLSLVVIVIASRKKPPGSN